VRTKMGIRRFCLGFLALFVNPIAPAQYVQYMLLKTRNCTDGVETSRQTDGSFHCLVQGDLHGHMHEITVI
jgi:hypothetical protein